MFDRFLPGNNILKKPLKYLQALAQRYEIYIHIYIYTYMCIHMCMYIYIYMYMYRAREEERDPYDGHLKDNPI